MLPLDAINRLVYMTLCRPTDSEMATLSPVHMTRDMKWIPSIYDSTMYDYNDWFVAQMNTCVALPQVTPRSFAVCDHPHLYELPSLSDLNVTCASAFVVSPHPVDFEARHRFFLGMTADVVKQPMTVLLGIT